MGDNNHQACIVGAKISIKIASRLLSALCHNLTKNLGSEYCIYSSFYRKPGRAESLGQYYLLGLA